MRFHLPVCYRSIVTRAVAVHEHEEEPEQGDADEGLDRSLLSSVVTQFIFPQFNESVAGKSCVFTTGPSRGCLLARRVKNACTFSLFEKKWYSYFDFITALQSFQTSELEFEHFGCRHSSKAEQPDGDALRVQMLAITLHY